MEPASGSLHGEVPARVSVHPLLKAAWLRRARLTRLLLEGDTDINVTTECGESALMLAIMSTYEDSQASTREKFVELLLNYGANPNLQERNHGSTVLQVACQTTAAWASGVIRTLLSYGADPTMPDHRGTLPIECAAWAGHTAHVLTILAQATKAFKSASSQSFVLGPQLTTIINAAIASRQQTTPGTPKLLKAKSSYDLINDGIWKMPQSKSKLTSDAEIDGKDISTKPPFCTMQGKKLMRQNTVDCLLPSTSRTVTLNKSTRSDTEVLPRQTSLEEITARLVERERKLSDTITIGALSKRRQSDENELIHSNLRRLPLKPTILPRASQVMGLHHHGSGPLLLDDISQTRPALFPPLNTKKPVPDIMRCNDNSSSIVSNSKLCASDSKIKIEGTLSMKVSPQSRRKDFFSRRSQTIDLADAIQELGSKEYETKGLPGVHSME